MDFKTLAQTVRREAGFSDGGPASVSGQSGELLKLVNWTRDAWRQIQTSRTGWRWLRATATTATVANTYSYSPTGASPNFALARWARWLPRTFRLYDPAVGVSDESRLIFQRYDDFREIWLFGTQAAQRPQFVTVDPAGNLLLGPKPDKVYTLYGDYIKSTQSLDVDGDTPECPSDFHMAIVWRALMRYGASDAAPEVYDDAKNRYEEEMSRLELDQLDPIEVGSETLVE